MAHHCIICIMAFFLCMVLQIKAGSTVAQTNPKGMQERQLIKVKTELMELRTVVLDRSGRIVENLKKEDIDRNDLEQIKMVQGIPFYGRDIFCEYSFRIHPGTHTYRKSEFVFMRELLKGGMPIKNELWLPIFENEKKVDIRGWFEIHDDMDLSSLSPGIYELRVSVKETKSNQTVQRSIAFGVE